MLRHQRWWSSGPVPRLAKRASSWHWLLGVAETTDGAADLAACAALAKRARVPSLAQELATADLAVELSIAPNVGRIDGYWEVKVRVECLGKALAISRISLVENVHAGHAEALSELDAADAMRLRQIAARDVLLSPPARLRGPGSSVEVTIRLPRLPSHVACAGADEAPPEMRVVEVVRA